MLNKKLILGGVAMAIVGGILISLNAKGETERPQTSNSVKSNVKSSPIFKHVVEEEKKKVSKKEEIPINPVLHKRFEEEVSRKLASQSVTHEQQVFENRKAIRKWLEDIRKKIEEAKKIGDKQAMEEAWKAKLEFARLMREYRAAIFQRDISKAQQVAQEIERLIGAKLPVPTNIVSDSQGPVVYKPNR